MAHGDAHKGKWRQNWRMEWVASTPHTTSEHGVSSITTSDARTSAAGGQLNWRPPPDLNGLIRFAERRNLVSARVPSHFKRSLNGWLVMFLKIATRRRIEYSGATTTRKNWTTVSGCLGSCHQPVKAVLTRSGQHARQSASLYCNSFCGDPDEDSPLCDEIIDYLSSLSCIHFDNWTYFYIKIYLGIGVRGGEGGGVGRARWEFVFLSDDDCVDMT